MTNHSLVSQKGVKQKSILTAALLCSLLPHKHLNTIQEACKGRRNCKNIYYCCTEIKMVYYKWLMFCTLNQIFVINNGVSFCFNSIWPPCNFFIWHTKSLPGANQKRKLHVVMTWMWKGNICNFPQPRYRNLMWEGKLLRWTHDVSSLMHRIFCNHTGRKMVSSKQDIIKRHNQFFGYCQQLQLWRVTSQCVLLTVKAHTLVSHCVL